jgi:hypothetical protein
MKRPDSFLTNTTAPAGRALGVAKNNPGDNSGSGMDKEIYNDLAYAALAVIESYKDGGNSDSDETTTASDMRDALEEMGHMRVTDSVTPANSVEEWDNATTYSAVTLVTWKGFQFVAYNLTGNLNKDPLTNPDYWHVIPKPDEMLERYHSGRICPAGMSGLADRAGGNYAQNIAYGRYRLGGNGDDFYDFFRVALDGSVVSGDGTLEAIMGVSGGIAHPFLDIFAPDVLGTRTLIDMGGRTTRAQSSGGKADTVGEVQEDAMQGFAISWASISNNIGAISRLAGGPNNSAANQNFPFSFVSDGVNGTPRIDSETRMANMVEGAAYIIAMQAA